MSVGGWNKIPMAHRVAWAQWGQEIRDDVRVSVTLLRCISPLKDMPALWAGGSQCWPCAGLGVSQHSLLSALIYSEVAVQSVLSSPSRADREFKPWLQIMYLKLLCFSAYRRSVQPWTCHCDSRSLDSQVPSVESVICHCQHSVVYVRIQELGI